MSEEHQVTPGEYITPGAPRALFNGICGGCHGSISGEELDVAVTRRRAHGRLRVAVARQAPEVVAVTSERTTSRATTQPGRAPYRVACLERLLQLVALGRLAAEFRLEYCTLHSARGPGSAQVGVLSTRLRDVFPRRESNEETDTLVCDGWGALHGFRGACAAGRVRHGGLWPRLAPLRKRQHHADADPGGDHQRHSSAARPSASPRAPRTARGRRDQGRSASRPPSPRSTSRI